MAKRATDKTEPYELLTVDVWDTLLRRDCHPDEVKLATAMTLLELVGEAVLAGYRNPWRLVRERQACEAALAARRRSAGGDDEYSAQDVLDLQLSRVAPSVTSERRAQLVDRLIQAENAFERRHISLDTGVLDAIGQIPHRKLGFISDFYHPVSVLRGHLQSVGVADRFGVAYVSSDHGVNKRSGRLYRHVHNDLGLSPAQHAHLGDNEDVDVRQPRSLGMAAHHYAPAEALARRAVHERRWSERQRGETTWVLRDLASLQPRDTDADRLASDLALIAGGLVLFAAAEARRAGCEKVFFFTREGELFLRIFQVLQAKGVLPASLSGELLEVSRVATFAASLRELTTTELMRLWNQYSVQSMAAFLASLDEPVAPYERILRAHWIDPALEINYPWQDERVRALLIDPAFVRPLSTALAEKRERLLGYLASKGFPKEGPVGIVDIGWRGTIQDNLCHLLPQSEIHGVYLGLQPYLNEQPPNGHKLAFGPDLNDPAHDLDDDMSMQFISPVEMLCNSPHGTTLGYRGAAEGFSPRRHVEEGENATWDRFTRHVQTAALDRMPALAEDLLRFSVSPGELQAPARARLHQLLSDPPLALAEAYFGLAHNETFGTGRVEKRSRRIPVEKFAKAALSRSGLKELWAFLRGTSWPQGWLRVQRLGMLVKPFNAQLRRWLRSKRPAQPVPVAPDERIRELERIADERARALRELEQRLRERDETIAQLRQATGRHDGQ